LIVVFVDRIAMAKDSNNERKGGYENKSKGNGNGQQRQNRGPPSKASKAILKLGPPPVSERTTSLKLTDALDNEVKERLDDYRDGDEGRILIDMLQKSISICNSYTLYNAGGDWRSVVQAVAAP